MNRENRRSLPGLAVALCLLIAGPALAVDEFHAYLMPTLPDTIYAAWHSTVDVPLWVDSSGRHFNGYDLLVRVDPEVVVPDTVLEGSLFTGACPNRWRRLTMTDSTFAFSHVLLCAGVSVNGPGTLCHLRLYASSLGISHLSILSDPDRMFYDAGYYVWPQHPTYPRQVYVHDAVLVVYNPAAGIPSNRAEVVGLDLRVVPNPVREACALEFHLPRAGEAELQLFQVDGRLIRTWPPAEGHQGANSLVWRPRDADGRRLPDGSYFLRLAAGSSTVTRRILLVQ